MSILLKMACESVYYLQMPPFCLKKKILSDCSSAPGTRRADRQIDCSLTLIQVLLESETQGLIPSTYIYNI